MARQNHVDVEVTEADLFGDLAGPFDMVAFDPPYLPTAPADPVSGRLNLAFNGGADGNETVLRFADQLLRLDPLPGVVLVVHSDLSDPAALQERLAAAGHVHEVVARQTLWFEELWVRRFHRAEVAAP